MRISKYLTKAFSSAISIPLLSSSIHAQGEQSETSPVEPEIPPIVAPTPPNVIVIITDDQGWGDFGIHGNKVFDTPHLDNLAKGSASWESFYVSPVCSPTRASLMTGRYNQRTKCLDTYLGRSMMASDEVTVAEALKGAGYTTGIFGKWHLGDNFPMRPSDQGFEYSLIHRGGGLAQPSEPQANNRRYTDPILFRNNREVETKGYCTDIYFEEAISFIKKSKENQRPFFAYIATNAPHGPFHDVPKDLLEKYQAKDISSILPPNNKDNATLKDKIHRVGAMATNIDDNVGKLIAALKKEKSLENTLIIYLNDNGPNSLRYTGAFKGMKSNVHEGGVRSPLWMHWPAKFKAGTKISSNSAAHIDIMPTIMDACNLGVPEAFAFDGRSLLKKTVSPSIALKPRPIVIQSHRGATLIKYHNFMVRDGKWKLSHSSGFGKTSLEERKPFKLYNIADDPGETKDLAAQYPDEVARLTKIYEAWFDDVTSTRIRDRGTPYILVERKEENPLVLTWQERIAKGWSFDQQGFWKLDFQHSTRVNVNVQHSRNSKLNIKGYTAVLQIGKTEYKAKVQGDSLNALFESINIPKGKHPLQAKFISPDGTTEIAAYQVHLTHR